MAFPVPHDKDFPLSMSQHEEKLEMSDGPTFSSWRPGIDACEWLLARFPAGLEQKKNPARIWQGSSACNFGAARMFA